MFDANLRGTPVGSTILVKFHTGAGKFGDITNIQTGEYLCVVGKGADGTTKLRVSSPKYFKEPMRDSVNISEKDIGNRWVTYEGHSEETIYSFGS